jgi:hypothetical protein
MINGMHAIIYSKNAEADKSFFKNILKLKNVDAGNGWLIFALPPSEIAVHPTNGEELQELYFMCDDINAFIEEMKQQNIMCSAVKNERWGLLTELTLPGGGKIGVYQPKHARP